MKKLFTLTMVSALFAFTSSSYVAATTPPTCYNITNAGEIGGEEYSCGSFDPSVITNIISPSGGSGTIEYIWLENSVPDLNGHSVIPGANAASYDPGPISQTTYYRRCARRSGCTDYVGETNWICKVVGKAPPCSAGNVLTDYANSVTYNSGVNYAANITGAPDGNLAQFWDNLDNVIVNFNQSTLAAGTEICVKWRSRVYTSSYSGPSTLDVYEIDATNNEYYLTSITTSSQNFSYDCVTLSRDIVRLKLKNPGNMPDFDVDALTYCYCSSNCNLTDGGIIAYDQSGCSPFDPTTIINLGAPNGGVGSFEYIWKVSTDSGATSSIIPGATSDSYDPGPLTVDTWYQRCARFVGCTNYDGNSNWIHIDITGTCNGGPCDDVLVSYGGNCNDSPDSFSPQFINSCITGVSDLVPGNGNSSASCDGQIICIASSYNYWEFNLSANPSSNITGIAADMLFPITMSTAGGSSNSSSCATNFSYTVKFFLNNSLVETKNGSIPSDLIITENIQLTNPISLSGSDVLKVEIHGNPTSTSCDLFELAGLEVIGCCQTPCNITINSVASDISCFGANDGSIDITASGGTAPYSYSWSNGASTQDLANLSAGTFNVVVTDANSCSATSSFTIIEPSSLSGSIVGTDIPCSIPIVNPTPCPCSGKMKQLTVQYNGSSGVDIEVYNKSDHSILIVSYSNVQTGQILVVDPTGILSGDDFESRTWFQIVGGAEIDIHTSCSEVIDGITVGDFTVLGYIDGAGSVCGGVSSNCIGTADLSVSGGTPPYSYIWSNGAVTEDLLNLCEGTYIVTITDANGCVLVDSVTISQQPNSITSTITATDASCSGPIPFELCACNGKMTDLTVVYTGVSGVDVEVYNKSDHSILITSFSNVQFGDILFVDPSGILSNNEFESTTWFQIVGGAEINIHTSCSQDIQGLQIGDFKVIGFTDGAGTVCNSSQALCPCDGKMTQLTLQYNGPSGEDVEVYNKSDHSILITSFNNVSYGQILVVNAVGNMPNDEFESTTWIQIVGGAEIDIHTSCSQEIQGVTVGDFTVVGYIDGSSNVCNSIFCDGMADLTVSGGTAPYTYLWSNGSTAEDQLALCAGTYTVLITDSLGCTQVDTVIVNELPSTLLTSAVISGSACPVINNNPTCACNGKMTELTVQYVGTSGIDVEVYNKSDHSILITSFSNVQNGQILVIDPSGILSGDDFESTTWFQIVNGVEIDIHTSCSQTVIGMTFGDFFVAGYIDGDGTPCSVYSCSGAINLSVSGGTGPYFYSWSNGAVTQDLSGLCAGTYIVTITDQLGCQLVDTFVVADTAGLDLSVQKTDVTCFGLCDGTVDLSIGSGLAPYTFSWSNGATTEDLNGLCPGTYKVIVADVNNCTDSIEVTITEPTVIVPTCSSTPTSCNAGTDGTAMVSAVGGTPPYTYAWNNGQNTAMITGLTAGVYIATVTDANNCTATCSATVTDATNIVLTCTGTDVSCNGGADGTASVNAVGGAGGFTYLWSNFATTASISGLTTGTYTVTVTDANQCQNICQSVVGEPLVISLSCSSTDVTCAGGMDGTASVNAAGGTPPYTYAWNNGGNTPSISNLTPGTYSVIVTDANACTMTCSVSVGAGAVLQASCIPTDVSCFGGNDGSVSVLVGGGTPPYTYLWNNGASTATISGLIAGTYTVGITDANGCSVGCSAIVNQPASNVSSTVIITDVSCNGGSDGAVDLTATGGTPPYTYCWTGLNQSATIRINAGAGNNYTSSTGDVFSADTYFMNGTPFTNLGAIPIAGTNDDTLYLSERYGGNDVSYDIPVANGTYEVVLHFAEIYWDVQIPGGIGSRVFCMILEGDTLLHDFDMLAIAPAKTAIVRSFTVDVTDGMVDLMFKAIVDQAKISAIEVLPVVKTEDLANLGAGTYNVLITDANGCTSTNTAIVNEPPALSLSAIAQPESCAGTADGSIDLSVSGGTPPYAYLWSNGMMTEDLANLSAGSYSVIVTDNNNCMDTLLGVNVMAVDSGCASLGNFVWNDLDQDGIQDPNEPGIAGVIVELSDCFGNIIATDTTDANGLYLFSNLLPGDYKITFNSGSIPSGFVFTNSNQGVNDSIDSDADPITGMTTCTTLDPGENDLTWDAGLYDPVNVGDYVWNDLNQNGIQDSNEVGVAGVVVQLIGPGPDGIFHTSDDVVLDTDTTDANGLYLFVDVAPGDYCIQFNAGTFPAGFVATMQDAGADDSLDSDIDALGKTTSFTVTAGQADDLTWDAGIYDPVNVGDYVWNDLNQNGIQDSNEVGVAGVVVQLIGPGPDGIFHTGDDVVLDTDTTDANGLYLFVDVAPGDYCIQFNAGTFPAGFVATMQDAGADDSLDSDIDALGKTTSFTVTAGQADDLTWDAGIYDPVNVGDYVWNDLNQNGIQDSNEVGVAGVVVQLIGPGPDGIFHTGDDVVLDTDTTDANGLYLFVDVAPGDYCIQFNAGTFPAGFVATMQDAGADDSLDSDIDALGKTTSFTVTAGQADDLTWDAGIYDPVNVGDYVWNDLNQNGIQDSNEVGVAGVVVQLIGPGPDGIFHTGDDVVLDTDTTDANGLYLFVDVAPGDYCIQFNAGTFPAGFVATMQDAGADDSLDSDIDALGKTTSFTVTAGQADDLTWDAGIYDPVNVGDYVWNDLNQNGIQDSNEVGVAGVVVQLIGPGPDGIFHTGDDVVLDTDTTDANGLYLFVDVAPGDYCIQFDVNTFPAGFVTTLQNQGGDDGLDSDINALGKTTSFTVSAGQVDDLTWDAGIYNCGVLINEIVTDVSCNGGSDGAIDITASNGIAPYTYLWSTTATTEDISGLSAGIYTVTVTDNNGCSAVKVITIGEPTILAASCTATNVSCNGGNDGTATVSANGGTLPYTYLWNDGQATATAVGLIAGTYKVLVTDSNLCVDSCEVTVMEPVILMPACSVDSNVKCFGGNDGGATVSATGGTAPYTYLWDDGTITASNSGLSAGTYSVTVFDANQCTGSCSVTITEPAPLQIGGTVTPVTCNAGSDGAIDLIVVGGTTPYMYAWSNGATTMDLDSLSAGIYSVVVTDANGCTATSSNFTIFEPTAVLPTCVVVSDVVCNGDSNGVASVSAVGGTGAISYLWSTGATTQLISGLTAGIYTATATDSKGCTGVCAVTVVEPPPLVVIASANSPACLDSLLQLNGSGANNYSWTGPNGFASLMQNPTINAAQPINEGWYVVVGTDTNGCVGIDSVFVAIVTNCVCPTLNIFVQQTGVSCNGGADAVVNLIVSGGQAPYSFLWSNGITTNPAFGFAAGSYTVTITDNYQCDTILNIWIAEPAQLSGSVTTSDVTCNGASDGSITAIPVGGTPPYTYLWSTIPQQTGVTATGLGPGFYSVLITDSNQCSTVLVASISEPTLLNVAVNNIDLTCFGDSNATATALPFGGTAGYSYLWSNGQTTAIATGLSSGSYSVIVTDANSCTAVGNTFVAQPPAINCTPEVIDASCFGGADGKIIVNAFGGIPPYSYLWNTLPAQTSSSIINLVAGNYSVTITDSAGCSVTKMFTVGEATDLTAVLTPTMPLCAGASDGSISALVSGGTPPYTYIWNNGQTSLTATGLSAGVYTLTVTDSLNCTEVQTIILNQPPALTCNPAVNHVLCNGSSTGSIILNASGGTPPYSYNWSNGDSTDIASGLAAGAYAVTITDANGCSKVQNFLLTEPTALTCLCNAIIQNVSCKAGNDGSATVIAQGGTPPYSFLWSTGSITAMANNLSAGNYTVTITDANGCIKVNVVTITEPTQLNATISSTDVSCNSGNDGTAGVNVSGGTPLYTYAWNTSPVQTNATATGLMAGTYFVNITDANNCTLSRIIQVNEPAAITCSIASTDATCNGYANGTAILTAAGGTAPLSYLWSNGSTDAIVTGLTAGIYTVVITDAKGCVDSCSTLINEPNALLPLWTQIDPSCVGASDGSIDLSVTGGTPPYMYMWSNSATTEDLNGLGAGIYKVTISDANGCVTLGCVILVDPPALVCNTTMTPETCNGSADGTATALVSGGTPPYTYLWSDGQATPVATGLMGGIYTVTVSDSKGCSSVCAIQVAIASFVTCVPVGTDVSCFGENDGTAAVNAVSGGTAPYSYIWSNGGTTSFISNLGPGTYIVTVTDVNGCSDVKSVTVSEPTALGCIATAIDITCGLQTGAAYVNVSGGIAPYSFLWNNGANNDSIVGLAAGYYEVVVTDANGCTTTCSATVGGNVLTACPPTFTPVSCNSGNNGTATACTTIGGLPPYTYLWSDNQTTATATGLTAGTYTVTVTDANSCTVSASVMVTEPLALSCAVNTIPAKCGLNNGSAIVNTNGGTPPYGYLWSDNSTSAINNNLAAGIYTVTVTDANGCMTMCQDTVLEIPQLSFDLVSNDVSCNGAADGSIAISNLAGGTSPFTYLWSNSFTTSSISNLGPGIYNVIVTDAMGCQVSMNDTIEEQPLLSCVASVVLPPSCLGSDGSANVVTSGGVPPYSYAWNTTPVQNTNTATGLSGGTYIVTVTDAANCTSTCSVTLVNPGGHAISLSPSVFGNYNLRCNGSTTGTVDLTVTGALGPVSYLWSNSATTEDIMMLGAGTYTVTVTYNGCDVIDSVTLTEPPVLSSVTSVSQTNLCSGDSMASVAVVVNGGTAPYNYMWNTTPVQSTASATGLTAGTYIVMISDMFGCVASDTVTVVDPILLAAACQATDASCNGAADGSVNLSVSGGTTPYSYSWSNSASTENLNNVGAGVYTVIVTDANGCTATCQGTVNEPTAISVTASQVTDVSCLGLSDGAIDITVSGGTGLLTYAWSNNATTEDLTNIPVGIYTVIITDSNNCSITFTDTVETDNSGCASIGDYVWDDLNHDGIQDSNEPGVANVTVLLTDSSGNVISTTVTDGLGKYMFENLIPGDYKVTFLVSSFPSDYKLTSQNVGLNDALDSDADPFTGMTLYTTLDPGENDPNWDAGIYSPINIGDLVWNDLDQDGIQDTNELGVPGISVYLIGPGPDGQFHTADDDTVDTAVTNANGMYLFEDVTPGDYCIQFDLNTAPAGFVATTQDAGIDNSIDSDINSLGKTDPFMVNPNQADDLSWDAGIYDPVNVGDFVWNDLDMDGIQDSNELGIAGITVYLIGAGPDGLFHTADDDTVDTDVTDVNGEYLFMSVVPGEYCIQFDAGTFPAGYVATLQSQGVNDAVDSDINSAGKTASFTINAGQPDLLTIDAGLYNCDVMLSAVVTDVNCNGGNDGAIDITASNGIGPYTYMWNDGSTDEDRSNLIAGTYTVTVSDDNSCSKTMTYIVGEPSAITAGAVPSPVSCNGGADGSIDLTVSGGTPPYNYLWSNNDSIEDPSGLPAGTYSVMITDSNGCMKSVNGIIVTEPTALLISGLVVTNVQCFGAPTGAIDITITGGTAPYTYLWSNNATTEDLSGVAAGTYTVVVTDDNNCTLTSSSITINQTSIVMINSVVTHIDCAGDSTGAIDLTPSGGTAPYTFLWSTGSTMEDISGLAAGNYTVTVKDVNMCSMMAVIMVSEPLPLMFTSTPVSDATCYDGADGSASVNVTGGSTPYMYVWANGQTTQTATGLSRGTYPVTITDNKGCVISDTSSIIVGSPDPLLISYIDTVTICNITTAMSSFVHGEIVTNQWPGAVISAIAGGSGADAVIIFDSDVTGTGDPDLEVGIGPLFTIPENVTDTNSDGLVDYPDDNQFGGLMIFDFNEPVNVNSFTFVDQDINTLPTVTAFDSTGAVITTVLVPNMGDGSVQIVSLNAVNVARLEIFSITSFAVTQFDIDCGVIQGGCVNGSIDLNVGGGVPAYTFMWSNGATTEDLTGVPCTVYTVTVTDANNCTMTRSIDLTPNLVPITCIIAPQNNAPCNGNSGTATVVSITGGVAPYSYSWNTVPPQNTVTATGLSAGTYSVLITDANGCTTIDNVTIQDIAPMSNSVVTSAVTCFGGNDGSFVPTILGGTAPFTYLWQDGSVASARYNLSRGTYILTVTDANGCTVMMARWINAPTKLNLLSTSIAAASCSGASDGVFTTSTYGGTPPYTYLWSDGATASDRFDLGRGVHTVTVTDANGCSTQIIRWINSPTLLRVYSGQISAASCATSNDGVFTTNTIGGTPPYTYLWTDGGTTQNRTDLSRGVWGVTVTDANGCDEYISRWINSPTPVVSIPSNVSPASCYYSADGVFTTTTWGGTAPYTYLWSDGGTDEDRYDLPRGVHTVTITDAAGCTKQMIQWIGSPANVTVSTSSNSPSQPNASDGDATVIPNTGAAPFTYLWGNGQQTQTATGLAQGWYSVTVTDNIGCSKLAYVQVTYGTSARELVDTEEMKYNLYPNPNTGYFTLELVSPTAVKQATFTLINIIGEQISSETRSISLGVNTIDYDVTHLHAGIYFLRIQADGIVKTIRVVKE